MNKKYYITNRIHGLFFRTPEQLKAYCYRGSGTKDYGKITEVENINPKEDNFWKYWKEYKLK